jgi:hypothetical protein
MAQTGVDSSLRARWQRLREEGQTTSAPRQWAYSELAAIQYAIAVGATAEDLPWVYEGYRDGFRVLPTMAILPTVGAWDWLAALLQVADDRLILGEQSAQLGKDLPPSLHAEYRYRLDGLSDKGTSALAQVTTVVEADGSTVAVCCSRYSIRGAGGFGTGRAASEYPSLSASGMASVEHEWIAPLEASVLYRLCGDLHPIHVDEEIARRAGHSRPPLHGMYLLGRLCRDLICRYDCAVNFARIRYRGAAYAQEPLLNRWWFETDAARCHVEAVERGTAVCQTAFALSTVPAPRTFGGDVPE